MQNHEKISSENEFNSNEHCVHGRKGWTQVYSIITFNQKNCQQFNLNKLFLHGWLNS